MRLIENFGVLLLSVWLVLVGSMDLFLGSGSLAPRVVWWVSILAGIFLFFRLQDRLLEVNIGFLFLGIWLTFSGILPLLQINFIGSKVLLSICAIGAGIFLIPAARARSFFYLGLSFLGVWLLGNEAVGYYGLAEPWSPALALIALVASLFLLLGL